MAKEKRPVIVVKKVKKGHGHHGGAWKVAFADFMTAMMAFFLVMWIIGMDEDVRGAIEGYFSNPAGFQRGYTSSNQPIAMGMSRGGGQIMPLQLVTRQVEEQRYREIAERLEVSLQSPDGLGEISAQIEIVVSDQGLRIELIEGGDGEMFFALGSSTLTPAAARALAIIGGELREASASLVIEGHTDAAPFISGSGYTNWELSSDRANAARRVLEAAGVSPQRFAEIRGHADRDLRVPDNPRDQANRRISILLPFSDPPETVQLTPTGADS
jgi:chemotaxis protein MotB